MPITINTKALDEINKTFTKIESAASKTIIKEFADKVAHDAYNRADKHTKTGAMINSFVYRSVDGGYEIGFDTKLTPHALFVHWATKPHKIAPKNKKMLRFVGKSGALVFKHWINHPGYEGDPFLYSALNDNLERLPDIMKKETGL